MLRKCRENINPQICRNHCRDIIRPDVRFFQCRRGSGAHSRRRSPEHPESLSQIAQPLRPLMMPDQGRVKGPQNPADFGGAWPQPAVPIRAGCPEKRKKEKGRATTRLARAARLPVAFLEPDLLLPRSLPRFLTAYLNYRLSH
jgi:hypothetical protein